MYPKKLNALVEDARGLYERFGILAGKKVYESKLSRGMG